MGLYHVSMDVETDLIAKDALAEFLAWWLDCNTINSVEDLTVVEI